MFHTEVVEKTTIQTLRFIYFLGEGGEAKSIRLKATLYVGPHCHSFSHTVKCVMNNVNLSFVICALFEHFIP